MDLRSWIVSEHASIGARFEQAIAPHVPVDRWKERADGGGASIAYLVLHTAWHADLAVTTVVCGEPPVRAAWAARLGVAARPSHEGLGEAEVVDAVAALDVEAVAAYANAVRSSVAGWLDKVDLDALDDVPAASERMAAAGVARDDVPWLHAMWEGKPASFFVQWEAIGHGLNHLGEMISVRGRLGLSPF